MKATPIFALFFAALLLSSVYLIQKQATLDINDPQTCYSISQQEVLLATLIHLENLCQKDLVFVYEYHPYGKSVSKKTTDCLSYQQQQLVGSYGGDDYSSVKVLEQKQC
ncbi:hypothetical protein ABPG72_006315 [Tetrahymena utriculariae]